MLPLPGHKVIRRDLIHGIRGALHADVDHRRLSHQPLQLDLVGCVPALSKVAGSVE
jgi:hypothetical protein